MHEHTLASRLVRAVTETAVKGKAGRVVAVRARLNAGAQVSAESLRTSFEFVSQGTVAEGAHLTVETAPEDDRRDLVLESIEIED